MGYCDVSLVYGDLSDVEDEMILVVWGLLGMFLSAVHDVFVGLACWFVY